MVDYYLISNLTDLEIKSSNVVIRIPEIFHGIITGYIDEKGYNKCYIRKIIDFNEFLINQDNGLSEEIEFDRNNIRSMPIRFNRSYNCILFKEEHRSI